MAGAAVGAAAALLTGAPPGGALVLASAAAVGSLIPDLDEPGSTGSRALVRHAVPCAAFCAVATAADVVWSGGAPSWQRLTWLALLPAAALACVMILLPFALRALFGHRGATHSLAAAAACGLGARLLLALVHSAAPGAHASAARLAAFAVGGLTLGWVAGGIVPDACTPGGVPLFWPVTGRKVHLLPSCLRLRTGGLFESCVVAPACAVLFAACALTWLISYLGVSELRLIFH
jgi:membrane-bound metal-dependent hydrolase YbcI (DUF457 family)